MTREELQAVWTQQTDSSSYELLQDVLSEADLRKFARRFARREDADQVRTQALRFLRDPPAASIEGA